MKKTFFAVLLILFFTALAFGLTKNFSPESNPAAPIVETSSIPNGASDDFAASQEPTSSEVQLGVPPEKNIQSLQLPLDRASERVTKKNFGLFVTPETSPVQPDKFQGYHTGTDFEIFPGEENSAVPVRAICDGKLVLKKTASGYGGMAVQNCEIDGNSASVVYGHLKLSSISKTIGENLQAGEVIGLLGKGFSSETDGARKHLHLSIHKGSSVNILGYIRSKSKLSGWLDPCAFVCR